MENTPLLQGPWNAALVTTGERHAVVIQNAEGYRYAHPMVRTHRGQVEGLCAAVAAQARRPGFTPVGVFHVLPPAEGSFAASSSAQYDHAPAI